MSQELKYKKHLLRVQGCSRSRRVKGGFKRYGSGLRTSPEIVIVPEPLDPMFAFLS